MKTMYTLIIMMAALLLASCDNAPKTWQEAVKRAIEENRPVTKEDFALLPMEDYTDPQQFDGPRIMFVGPLPWPEEIEKGKGLHDKALWSMKPDGSDLRMVMTREEFFGTPRGCCINDLSDLARSRDNRYIAFITQYQNVPGAGDYEGVWLFDLKTRTFSEVFRKPAGGLRFSYDNDKLSFFAGYFYVYDIKTRTLEKRDNPLNGLSGYALSGPDNTIVAHRDHSIYYFTFDGKPIKELDLRPLVSEWEEGDFRIAAQNGSLFSDNGKYAVLGTQTNLWLNLTETPSALPISSPSPGLLPNAYGLISNQGAYYKGGGQYISKIIPEWIKFHLEQPLYWIPKELMPEQKTFYFVTRKFINESE